MEIKPIIIITFSVLAFISCRKNQCIYGDCLNGVGVFKYKNNGIDSGMFVNGGLTGFGKQVMGEGEFEGDIYIGEFKNGRYDGYGTYYHSKQDAKYIGYAKKGKRHGKSKVVFDENSIIGSKTFYGIWENGICEEYEKFIRISKNGEHVFYDPVKFMDSLTFHTNYSTRIIRKVMDAGVKLYQIDLQNERVRFEDIEKLINLVNLGEDTLRHAISNVSHLKEYDETIQLKKATLNYLEFYYNAMDNEFRQWAIRFQYPPSDVKLSQIQDEVRPIVDNARAVSDDFKEIQNKFMNKYKIIFKEKTEAN